MKRQYEEKISRMSNVLLPSELNEYIDKSAIWKWFISRSDNLVIDIRYNIIKQTIFSFIFLTKYLLYKMRQN